MASAAFHTSEGAAQTERSGQGLGGQKEGVALLSQLSNALLLDAGDKPEAAMATCKKFCGPRMNTTLATTLQLVKLWMYKDRHIVGDYWSWFASFETAVACTAQALLLLYWNDPMIKTTHLEFPH